jgi:hypothetical protein
MNVKKLSSKKAVKFLGLLISAMIIAGVSASVYNYMYIQGSGVASTAEGLKWELGTNLPSPAPNIVGYTVTNLNFSTSASPANYSDCLRIKNQDLGEAHSFTLRTKKSWGGMTDYQKFNLVVFNATTGGTQQEVLDLKTPNDQTATMSIPANKTWSILVEIVPVSSPTGTKAFFEVELEYISAA